MEAELQIEEVEPQPAENALVDGNSQWDVEKIIEQIWLDLEGKASHHQIRKVLMEIAPAYENAQIKTFVPIFLRKEALQRLQDGLAKDQEAQEL